MTYIHLRCILHDYMYAYMNVICTIYMCTDVITILFSKLLITNTQLHNA